MSDKTEKPKTAYESLSIRWQRFVDEYVVDFNATRAAIRAGYSAKTAQVQSSKLLSKPIIKAAVDERKKSIKKRTVDYRQYLIKKSRRIIDKCSGDERWNPQGANGAIRNMVDILGLKTEKYEVSGPNGGAIQVQHDLTKLSSEELKALLALLEKTQ